MPTLGDKVKLVTKQETIEGILLPSPDKKVVMIKLDNGYNVGFPEKDVSKITVLEKAAAKKELPINIIKNKNLPTISILHTGGTIASKVDYKTGGVFAGFTNEDFLSMFPEMSTIANIRSRHVANLMSEDMRFNHYQLLATAIEEEIKKGTQGIIIGHGTDTIAITAAALSFMLENVSVPVILVGSQRSSDRGSTDAAMNLFCAAQFIIHSGYQGVGICMHEHSSDTTC
ncbi:MAG: asparaginase domain-containing protein, partial [Nanoarchaeota archaeon]|nr:asparaginase domain-containing protein [Nanoarchaeota archaeon]